MTSRSKGSKGRSGSNDLWVRQLRKRGGGTEGCAEELEGGSLRGGRILVRRLEVEGREGHVPEAAVGADEGREGEEGTGTISWGLGKGDSGTTLRVGSCEGVVDEEPIEMGSSFGLYSRPSQLLDYSPYSLLRGGGIRESKGKKDLTWIGGKAEEGEKKDSRWKKYQQELGKTEVATEDWWL